MVLFKAHAMFFLIYLVTNNSVNARPYNKQMDSRYLQEDQIPSESTLLNSDESNPKEQQKAVCTVTAGDVKASAEAFTTTTLKGVCGSAEMLSAFSNLENKFSKELQEIRKLLDLLYKQQQQQRVVNNNYEQNISENSSESPVISTTTTIKLEPFPLVKKYNDNETTKLHYMSPNLKSLQNKDIRNTSLSAPVREHEISLFNNTLLTDRDIKIFTYYWKMENFTTKINKRNSISIESPIFSIKGKAFKIKAHFQHLHRDFLFIQLEDVSSSQMRLHNSIILDTGGVFKEIDSNNFKYKISILDQNKKRAKDLVSQELDNHEKGLLIPNSALLDSSFIKDDALLIQILLYI